jgi:hypothetical protein
MKKKGSLFTVAIALCGIAIVVLVSAYRYVHMQNDFKALLLAAITLVYSLWILSEFRVTVGEADKKLAEEDQGTCEAYATGRLLTML